MKDAFLIILTIGYSNILKAQTKLPIFQSRQDWVDHDMLTDMINAQFMKAKR